MFFSCRFFRHRLRCRYFSRAFSVYFFFFSFLFVSFFRGFVRPFFLTNKNATAFLGISSARESDRNPRSRDQSPHRIVLFLLTMATIGGTAQQALIKTEGNSPCFLRGFFRDTSLVEQLRSVHHHHHHSCDQFTTTTSPPPTSCISCSVFYSVAVVRCLVFVYLLFDLC